MTKCAICRAPPFHLWQPCGPGEDIYLFPIGGYHYRGFPAIHVCSNCIEDIRAGKRVEFTYKGTRFECENGKIKALDNQSKQE